MKTKLLVLFLLTIFFYSCKEKEKSAEEKKPFADCKCGRPTPIFNSNVPDFVSGHNFAITSDAGVEIITYKNGTKLQIVQTGCNDIRQEFSFIYTEPKFSNLADSSWVNNAIDEFRKIGGSAPEFQPFALWGNAIEARKQEFHIGEDKELEKGFFVKVDKIASATETTMIVTVYADDCPGLKK